MAPKSFIEVQFPIGHLSLESYLERETRIGKVLNSLGKWWGSKPVVLTRAIILGTVFPASDDSGKWPRDLEIFLKCMTFDSAGMLKRKIKAIPADVCYPFARPDEKDLFATESSWIRGSDPERRDALETHVFLELPFHKQREFCCRAEQIDGPTAAGWEEINAYLGTTANSLAELVRQLSIRRFGSPLRVGDAFSGMGSIPFEAAELGCDVYASDLNPVASLLTWGALNIIASERDFHDRVVAEQARVYNEVDEWFVKTGFETSREGWRATLHFYCLEIVVPEWDGWRIPLVGTWQILKSGTWVELIPVASERRFDFKLHKGGAGFAGAASGTKQQQDVVCPDVLWNILHRQGKTKNITPRIALSALLNNHGGLRQWAKSDMAPRPGDFYQERLYCIRWQNDDGKTVFREPQDCDLAVEAKLIRLVESKLSGWQADAWVPDWRIQDGVKTHELIRTRGWTYWHHLFTARQLLMAAEYSRRIADVAVEVRPALILALGQLCNYNAKLCRWDSVGNSAKEVFYNQALNTLLNYVGRGWKMMKNPCNPEHAFIQRTGTVDSSLCDAREVQKPCHLWITDPPYADAVKYEELSEFFLAWYAPHLKSCFPSWYADSMRDRAVTGDDAPFRVAMAECYRRLAEKMPDNGMQVLMFTHKDTDVWEDLALIMWAAGLQVKQVWSIATETAGAGIRVGNYVQSTYNMVLRKRTGSRVGFMDFITPQVNQRVRDVIRHMRDSQIAGSLVSCGYTDTDYLLAAQAVAAEVVTGYASIEGVDLDEELRTPNKQRGNSALRKLMDSAKRTATDFLVPSALELMMKSASDGTSAYNFWRSLSLEEKFLLKGLEMENDGVNKIGAFQDLGSAYCLAGYEELMGPARTNEARTKLPDEFPRPDMEYFSDVAHGDRGKFSHSVTRHLYYAMKFLKEGAEMERAIKHLIDCTDFWQERHSRHLHLLGYLLRVTSNNQAWHGYRPILESLAMAVENWRA